MTKADGIKLTKVARLLATVLDKNRREARFLEEREEVYFNAANMSVREMVATVAEKHETAAEEWRHLADSAALPLTVKDMERDFDETETKDKDIHGQGNLLDPDDQEAAAIGKDLVGEKQWGISQIPLTAIDNGIITAVRDGSGRNKAIELVVEATGKTKFEVEERFNCLIRNGSIEKVGRNWVCQAEPVEAQQEEQEAA